MVNFNILYDNNNTQGIFFSGQTLSGSIQIINEKRRSIKGISLKIEGYAKCKWTEYEGSGKHSRTIAFSGREDYMSTFSYLIGSYNSDNVDLAEGTHQFNFVCNLPQQSPTSLESKYGSIRYQIKVVIERPWKTDIKHCFGFTVIKPLDLNYENQSLRMPLKAEVSKSFFLGFSSKTLYMTAQIQFCCYVSGQAANVDVSVNNESSVEIIEIVVELMKLFNYNSDTPKMRTRKREERAAFLKFPGVAPKSKKGLIASLIIPTIPPTNIGTCRVVQIYYEIHVTAKVSGLHRNLTIALPITIGTVPLVNSNQNDYHSLQGEQIQSGWNVQASTSQAPLPPTNTDPLGPNQFDLPPPSYQEAVMTTTREVDKDEGISDQTPYNPMYPVFNFANQQAMAPPFVPPYQSSNEKSEKS